MSVISTCLQGGASANFPIPWGGREITVPWTVKTNSANDEALTVLAGAPSVANPGPSPPALAGAYTLGSAPTNYLYARNIRLTQHPTIPTEWTYAVTFSEWQLQLSGQELANPVSRPTEYWTESGAQTKAALVNYESTGSGTGPIANSAGQPFVPPLELEDHHTVIVVRRNENNTFATIVANKATYEDKINSAAVTINGQSIAARCGWMLPIQVSPLQSENNVPFYSVTYRVAYDPGEWKETPVDLGMKYKTAGGELRAPTDEHGDFMFGEPVKLNGIDGQKLADTAVGVLLDGGGSRLGPLYPRQQANFTALSL